MDNFAGKPENPEKWDDHKLSEWFNRGEWKSGWHIPADETVNRREMARHYNLNPDRWNKAFQFLKNLPVQNLSPGRIALDGDDLYAVIDEYVTRNEEDCRFEAHRRYADIQYLVSGVERIGVVPLRETAATGTYDGNRDIVFLESVENNYRPAGPSRFFVFFPGDAHKPCVKDVSNVKVLKIVIKVRLEE